MAIGPLYLAFLAVAEAQGIDAQQVLAPFNLTKQELTQPRTRLDPSQGRAFARRVHELVKLPALGLRAAEHCQLRHLDLVYYMLNSAPTLLLGLTSLARYSRLLGDTANLELERTAERLQLDLGRAGGHRFQPDASDFVVAVMFRALRELSRGQALPLGVGLPRPRPKAAASYAAFFGVPIRYDSASEQLAYRVDDLRVSPPGSDARLWEILRERADAALREVAVQRAWIVRVRAEIAGAIAEQEASAEQVAQRCSVSERTLRRRLREAGTGFRDLVEDVRRERALSLIAGGERNVMAVALQTGYSDTTAFARAFRRWTGTTPALAMRAANGS